MIIKLELPIELTKEDSLFIAICPVFCVGSQGKTEEEALSNAKEALQLYLEDEDVQREHADEIMQYAVSLIFSDKEFKSDIHSSDYHSNIHLLDVEIHGKSEATKPLGA